MGVGAQSQQARFVLLLLLDIIELAAVLGACAWRFLTQKDTWL